MFVYWMSVVSCIAGIILLSCGFLVDKKYFTYLFFSIFTLPCIAFYFLAILVLSEKYGFGYYPNKILDIFCERKIAMEVANTDRNLTRFAVVYSEGDEFSNEKRLLFNKGDRIRSVRMADKFCMICHSMMGNWSKMIVFEEGCLCHFCHLYEKLCHLFLSHKVMELFESSLPKDVSNEVIRFLHFSYIDQFVLPSVLKFPNHYFQFCPILPPRMQLIGDYYEFNWSPGLTLRIHIETNRTLYRQEGEGERDFETYHEAIKFITHYI